MEYKFDLATYPGEFDFRAENLKIEWRSGAEKPAPYRDNGRTERKEKDRWL